MLIPFQTIRKNLVFMLLVTVIPVLGITIGLSLYYTSRSALKHTRFETNLIIHQIIDQYNSLWQTAFKDSRFVSAVFDEIEITDETPFTGRVRQHLSELGTARGIYSSIVYVNSQRKEAMTIYWNQNKSYISVPEEGLERHYDFLPEGNKNIFSLNGEEWTLGIVLKNSELEFGGMILLNVNVDDVLYLPGTLNELEDKSFWFLVNDKGEYLKYSGDKEEGMRSFQEDFPLIHEAIIKSEEQQDFYRLNSMLVFAKESSSFDGLTPRLYAGRAFPVNVLYEDFYDYLVILILVILVLLVIEGKIVIYLSSYIDKPIQELSNKFDIIKQGDLSTRAQYLTAPHEILRLTISFNKMAEKVESLKLGLNKKVAERTQELESARKIALELMKEANSDKLMVEEAMVKLRGSEQESQRRARWAQSLQIAGEQLSACRTVSEVIRVIAFVPVDLLGLKACWVCRRFDNGELKLVSSSVQSMRGHEEKLYNCASYTIDSGHSSFMFDEESVYPYNICDDYAGVDKFGCFLIRSEEKIYAVLIVASEDELRPSPVEQMKNLLEVFCRQIAYVWQRIETEEEMQKLSSAVVQSPVSVMITNRSGVIEYVNPKFCKVTLYSQDDVLGRSPSILKSGLQGEVFYRRLWQTILKGEEWHGEFCNRKKNGEIFWESASISSIRNLNGAITHFIAVKEDITEKRKSAIELKQAKEAAESATRAKSNFLAHMSHEIRTPMNAIMGFSQILYRDRSLSERQHSCVDSISRSGEHLMSLINDILEMSKIEAGKVEMRATAFNIFMLLDDLEMMFRVQAESRGVQMVFNIEKRVPQLVFTDENKLRQVLINLIGNAMKFTYEGSITLSLKCSNINEGRKLLSFQIEDTGKGIEEESLKRLFEPFVQSESGKRSNEGTGLGLAITREHINVLGGEITVESELDKGTVFKFNLPVGSIDEKTKTSGDEKRVKCLKNEYLEKKILVVDDKEENCILLETLLGDVGFKVKSVYNGLESIHAIQEWNPDLVFMDISMPVMGGKEATRKIRELESGSSVPVIALTASAFLEDRKEILDAGVDDFISKPFYVEDLLQVISNYLKVEYEYEVPEIIPSEIMQLDSREDLKEVPDTLLDKMLEVTINGYMNKLMEYLDELHDIKPEYAGFLKKLADNYEYEKLLKVLKKD